MNRRVLAYVGASVVILIPCFWHSRIQAGDLGSHIYNAWLVQLIEAGRAPGLVTAPQSTNVLFDYLLKALLDAFGPDVAQHAAVSLAVLVLVWGAFAFVCQVSGRTPWHLLPAILMLAYGWVFRMGLFNFYLSLGLCFWALSLAWDGRPRKLAAAVPALVLAYVAQSLPVAWALALLAYQWLAGRLGERQRMFLLGAGLAAIAVASAVLRSAWRTIWYPQQFTAVAAIDQIWIYGGRYVLLAALLLLCWASLLAGWVRSKGLLPVVSGVPFQICALTAAGILIIPDWIRIPGYNHALVYLAERMALALGICVCAMTGAAPVRRAVRYALPAIALFFFVFSYEDEAALNSLEDQMEALVVKLPPGQRVVNGVVEPGVPTNPTIHMIDRVCVRRCYSYGNYEPASAAFRIRIAGDTPIVVAIDADAGDLQTGTYVVKERDVPLYQVVVGAGGKLEMRELAAGQTTGITPWHGL